MKTKVEKSEYGKISNKCSEVEPFRNKKDIELIKQYLHGKGTVVKVGKGLRKPNLRNYLIFVMGINVGLRAGDLLNLKIKDVYKDGVVVDEVEIKEEKTKKTRKFRICKNVKEAIVEYIYSTYEEGVAYDNEYLFASRQSRTKDAVKVLKDSELTKYEAGDKVLTIQALHKIIKDTAKTLNIKGNYGTHSLRKTWAYQNYTDEIKTNPSILQELQKALNHSKPSVTLAYIGITKEQLNRLYDRNY
jgi:integrase